MPGNQTSTTYGRKTRVRFDVEDLVALNSAWGNVSIFDQMTQQGNTIANSATLIQGMGWMITPYQIDMGVLHELNSSQAAILKAVVDGGTLQVASGVVSKYAWRKPTELIGVMTGSSTGVSETGDYMLHKNVAASGNWGDISIEDGFPGLDDSDCNPPFNPNIRLARLAVDTVMQDGSQPVMFRFVTTGAKASSPDVLFVWYFSGPASIDQAWKGEGRYAMVIKGDGKFLLYERAKSLTSESVDPYLWRLVKEGRYAPTGQVANTHHRIIVFPGLIPNTRNGRAGALTIIATVGDKANNNTQAVVELFKGTNDNQIIKHTVTYNPGIFKKFLKDENPPPVNPMAMRVDQRADLRSAFQLSYVSFSTEGYVITKPWIFPSTLATTKPITVQWFGNTPAGTTITVSLFDCTVQGNGSADRTLDAGITPSSTGVLTGGGYAIFNPYLNSDTNTVSNSYQVRFKLNGLTDASPILTSSRILINGVIDTSSGAMFEIEYPATITEVNISGPESDPSHETASLSINDLGAEYNLLNTRGEFPVRIDTEYPGVDWTNPANDGLQSVLFDGYAIQSPAHRMGSNMPVGLGSDQLASFPSRNWKQYKGTLVGKWKRLSETVSTFNWDFSIDPDATTLDTPPYAVDVIKSVISWAGFPDSMIDIGAGTTSSSSAFAIRLFPKGQDQGIVLNSGANLADFVLGLARDYLGAALIWDANATAASAYSDYTDVLGCWRLLHPKTAPYNYLVNFTTTGPTGLMGGAYAANMLTAYGTSAGASGQTIINAPIFKDTLDTYVSPPEVNKVVVTGTGELTNSDSNVANQLTVFAVNASSYNFNGVQSANVNNSDYIGRERVGYKVDTIGINTPEAAAWVCRRFYDLTAHAIKFVTFTAPLVLVTDVTDTKQVRPRPLRFYDAITIDGLPYLIRNVNPYYNKDHCQLAHYECQSIPPAFIVPQ